MFMRRSCRFVFAVLLLAVLVQPAWGVSPERQTQPVVDLLDHLWDFLTGVWAEAGCIIDPNGSCGLTPAAPGIDEGCILDPHGAAVHAEPPAPTPATDEGCIIDPHGGCAPRS